jgi:hypothetical protein
MIIRCQWFDSGHPANRLIHFRSGQIAGYECGPEL